jgi:hypothetical protein
MFTAIAVVVALGVGFGIGRVKNASKLKAVATFINEVETKASAEVKQVVAAVRAKL